VFYTVVRLLALWILRIGFRFRTIGAENVPAEGPVLLASNHVSLLDPPVVGVGAVRPLHFMAKAELFQVPLLGGVIRRLNAHPVEREGADATALRHALSLLRAGHALLVFPEGTRGTEGALGVARAGTGMLVARSGAPVVPVYVQGSGRAWPRGAARPRPARITVAYGPPLTFERGRGRDRYREISDEVMAGIARLKAAVEGVPVSAAQPAARASHAERTARGPLPVGQIHQREERSIWNT